MPEPSPLRSNARPLPGPWPTPARPLEPKLAKAAEQFEVLIAERLLKGARAARLGDDLLGANSDMVRDQIDHARAEAIARAAPIGIARLLAP
ncbi:MAG: hypothetical protein WCO82_09555 [Sphingomonadales bacterium]|jgi:Rod binding domain-containing protein